MNKTKLKSIQKIIVLGIFILLCFVLCSCKNKDPLLELEGIIISESSELYCKQFQTPTIYYTKKYTNGTIGKETRATASQINFSSAQLGNQTLTITHENKSATCTIFVYNKIILNGNNANTILTNLTANDFLAVVNSDISLQNTNSDAHLKIDVNNVYFKSFNSSFRAAGTVKTSLIEITSANATLDGFTLYPYSGNTSAVLVNGTLGAKNTVLKNLTLTPNAYEKPLIKFASTLRFVGNVGNSLVENCTLNKARIDVSLAKGTFCLSNSTFHYEQVAQDYLTLFPFYKGENYSLNLSGYGNHVVVDTRMQAYDSGTADESFITNFDPIDWSLAPFVEYKYE